MSGHKITIRQAKPADAESISMLIIPVMKKYVSYEYSEQGKNVILASLSTENIQSNLTSNYQYLLAENTGIEGAKLVGVLGIKNGDHIFHCFVRSNYHRKQIANNLWSFWLSQNRPKQVSVYSSRYAIQFYQSLGFVASDECFEENGVVCYPMILETEILS